MEFYRYTPPEEPSYNSHYASNKPYYQKYKQESYANDNDNYNGRRAKTYENDRKNSQRNLQLYLVDMLIELFACYTYDIVM